jgi:hypothetical protein
MEKHHISEDSKFKPQASAGKEMLLLFWDWLGQNWHIT